MISTSSKIWIASLLSLTTFGLSAQFLKHYPATNISSAWWVTGMDITSDNGYVATGWKIGPYSHLPLMLKTGKGGKLSWLNSYYLSTSTVSSHFYDVKQSPWNSQEYLAVGYIGTPMLLTSISASNGQAGASVKIEPNFAPYGYAIARSMEVLPNGNIAIVGNTTSKYASITLLNNGLGLVGSGIYTFDAENQNILDVVRTKDNGFVMVGISSDGNSTPFTQNDKSIFILKVDQNLNHQWNKKIDVDGYKVNIAFTVSEARGGDLYVAGLLRNAKVSTPTPYVMKLNEVGQVGWINLYSGHQFTGARFNNSYFDRLKKELVLSCNFTYNAGETSIGFMKMKPSNGEVFSAKWFNSSLNPDKSDGGFGLVPNPINGYTLGGKRIYSGESLNGFFIIETDKDGRSGTSCEEEIKVAHQQIGYVESSFTFLTKNYMNVSSISLVTVDEEASELGCGEAVGAMKKSGIYPNPASDQFQVVTDKTVRNVRLGGLNGDWYELKMVDGFVSLEGIEAGIYIVEITFEGGEIETHTLVKK